MVPKVYIEATAACFKKNKLRGYTSGVLFRKFRTFKKVIPYEFTYFLNEFTCCVWQIKKTPLPCLFEGIKNEVQELLPPVLGLFLRDLLLLLLFYGCSSQYCFWRRSTRYFWPSFKPRTR